LRRAAILQVLALVGVVPQADAQSDLRHIRSAAINAAIGGLTAGVWRGVARKPFWPAFGRGAGSGLAIYAGKLMIAGGKSSGWWTGRQLAAIGSSEVANAAHGRAFLQQVILPLGPVRIHLDRVAKQKAWASLDAVSTVAAVVVGSRSGNHFGLSESLATGAIVFIAPEVSNAVGGNTAGIITISELAPDGDFPPLESKRSIISHEMIHSAQYDFALTAWSDAAEAAIARRLRRTGGVLRYVDFNLILPVQVAVNAMLEYKDRPWEQEAESLAEKDR
jgi:hypothetical protein